MKIIGVIPARYASSRFPGKPLADICGKPMIWWTYHQAKKVKEIDEVYVATDDDRIKAVCEEYNMNVVMTSNEHQTGTDRIAEVAEKVEADIVLNIQGDEPVIEPLMISELIKMFDDEKVYFATLKSKLTDENDIKNTSVVKVVSDLQDKVMFFSRSVIPSNTKTNANIPTFRHIGLYGYTKEFLLKFAKLEKTPLEIGEDIEPIRALENGYSLYIKETNYNNISVDNAEDIDKVEKFINKMNLI